MIGVFYDNAKLRGDFAYANGRLVSIDFDLETALLLSLTLDAPALPGDVLPSGTPRSGYWADRYFGTVTGSRLWLLRNAVPNEANARRAEAYGEEAVRWIVSAKHLRKATFKTELKSEAIWMGVDCYLPNGALKTLGPMKVT